ncbi:MAG: DNA-3-methyladenine glycosylase [Pelobium sp.]
MKLPLSFYQREDTLLIAKELIGKSIFTKIDDELSGGMIVETEAYMGPLDAGSHAFNGRKTLLNNSMYLAGGVAYLYICYGIHDMFNIVTGKEGTSHAILIRAIEPKIGLEHMQARRGDVLINNLAKGPGSLAKALGLNKSFDGKSLLGNELWLEDRGIYPSDQQIIASPRIGLNCAAPYCSIPWRFTLFGSKFVSKQPNISD